MKEVFFLYKDIVYKNIDTQICQKAQAYYMHFSVKERGLISN